MGSLRLSGIPRRFVNRALALGFLEPKGRGQQTKRQRNGEVDDLQHPVQGDPEDAKWQQQQPDEWIGNQRQQSQRPAQHKQNAPQEESEHGETSVSSWLDTRDSRRKFPWIMSDGTTQDLMWGQQPPAVHAERS